MEIISVRGGKYGAETKINNKWYGFLPKSRWYEFLLPFNMIYLGHYVGERKGMLRKSKQNQFDLIAIGWGLGGILSAILVQHSVNISGVVQGIFNMSLFLFGSIGMIIWFTLRRKLWLGNRFKEEYPRLYLVPTIRATWLNIFFSLFMIIMAIFFIVVTFDEKQITDWRAFIGLPLYGALFGLSGFFANIPLQNNKYYIRKIKYQGREITVPELEQIIKNLEVQQNDKSN
ncbi:hypothetical protein [Latilactobacillus graminis]|uniref:Uncharacterized protein n=2 Tax=Latilactobacillus graminis TaxID=60519 RepID=A0AA89I0H7_9LACO|nr:hypothetical protein [Latilactobacillus graminis]KRM22332.1 hypothetical protein FC90_GL000933 [Latilactobacillus graminis DSM 20719]QFP79494.1 hypothetical protein LG542_04285 [Latilactobacillus graminis]